MTDDESSRESLRVLTVKAGIKRAIHPVWPKDYKGLLDSDDLSLDTPQFSRCATDLPALFCTCGAYFIQVVLQEQDR
jgi:hypothetical protein